MTGILNAGDLDRTIRIEGKVKKAGGGLTAGQDTWVPFAAVVNAQVMEMLPSRGERMVEGLKIALRPARVRMRYRTGITADMRIIYAGRTMQIMAAPIELGFREGLELIAQDFSSSGNSE